MTCSLLPRLISLSPVSLLACYSGDAEKPQMFKPGSQALSHLSMILLHCRAAAAHRVWRVRAGGWEQSPCLLCEVDDRYWYVRALSPFCGMHIEHPTLCSPHSLDQLLDAGLYTGEVTELAGAPGSGKTQVCLSIAASVSLGLRQHVVFLDSTGGFTASRLYQMLQSRVEDKEEQLEALQRVQVIRVFDIYEMLRALHEVRDCLSQQVESSAGPLKAVLIDSVSAVLSPLLGGQQSEGLAIMMQLARELKTLAKEFSVVVLVTNQVTRDSSTGALKSALGRSWSFVPSTRVLLQGRAAPWEEGTAPHTACLAKSPRQPTGIQVQLDIGNNYVQKQRPATPTP
ncbi:DNA repair protein RAD51 homolog 4 isoform X3 [Lagopus leucura]|uniref:DNA repair protein RAD51 homolog 4 isoform X3 n=1 Tax=Lagopus leucura TaxID=30410 RepID=UPI001C684BD7|nr:DNA repair protein RAD51 homolog 4 isoform X3 [Lagopus leucura]